MLSRGLRSRGGLQAYAEVRHEALLGLSAALLPLASAAQRDPDFAGWLVLEVKLEKLLAVINDLQVGPLLVKTALHTALRNGLAGLLTGVATSVPSALYCISTSPSGRRQAKLSSCNTWPMDEICATLSFSWMQGSGDTRLLEVARWKAVKAVLDLSQAARHRIPAVPLSKTFVRVIESISSTNESALPDILGCQRCPSQNFVCHQDFDCQLRGLYRKRVLCILSDQLD